MKEILIVGVALFLLPSPSAAQSRESFKGWLGVDFMNSSSVQGQDPRNGIMNKAFQPVPADIVITYPELGSTLAIQAEGGVRLPWRLGVGIQFSAMSHDGVVELGVTVPHPVGPAGVSASAFKDVPFQPIRRERALDIVVVYHIPVADRWQVRLLGGPSYIWFSQQSVTDFTFGWDALDQAGAINVIHIANTVQSGELKGHAWGYNVGGDVSYFFKPAVGLGAVAKLNRASFQTVDPVTGNGAEISLGHVSVGGGLRIRF